MSETPRYVLEAVRAFIEEDRREPLINQFHNGIPLHSYPESRELLEKMMRSEAIRPHGRPSVDSDPVMRDRNIGIQIYVAQFVGAEIPLIANESTTPTACSVVGNWHGLTSNQVKAIWNKGKDSPLALFYMNFGRENAESVLEFFRQSSEV